MDDMQGRAGMLEGEIGEINLIDRLVELWREEFTGAIRFENDGIIKIVYFKSGDILSASTNDRADSVDEILMRAGKVSREHVKQALAKRKESETLGDALLNLGFITRKELTWARRVQVVGVIRSIAAWTTGSFTIVADYLPKRDEGTLFPLPQVLVELIVTDQDRQKFDRLMDGGEAVFRQEPHFADVFRRLGLNEDAEAIAAAIDGTNSAAAVAAASGRDTFNVYKLLHALATLGVLTRADKPQVSPEGFASDFETAGVADAADLWDKPTSSAAVGGPMFELDEAEAAQQPTLEIPAVTLPPEPVTPAGSGWEEAEVPAPAPAPLPAWDAPPRTPAAVPIPARIEPAAEAEEEQWGFDEAQVETARRAAAGPLSTPRSKPGTPMRRAEPKSSRYGLVVALIVLALVAALGYAGFLWWQGREAASAVSLTPLKRTPRPPAVAHPAETGTIVEATSSVTPALTDTSTTILPATIGTTTAPVPAAGVTTAAPTTTKAAARPAPVTPSPSQALPAVTARSGSGSLDEQARQYAANPVGNFTVQIQILCSQANLTKAVQDGGGNVWFVPQPIGARSCYRVFWGHYDTREQAQRALTQIPPSLRDPSAAVKPVPRR